MPLGSRKFGVVGMCPRMVFAIIAALSVGRTALATDEVFERSVSPYLRAHCYSCHDAKQAKAGFRVDQLSSDLSAARMAEHWKEVADRINAGEMPPAESPRPTAQEQTPVVEWINVRLREAELAAKSADGRTPMRRLNREEYANTIRDLLFLDENFVRPLVEDLPGDGKAEGFDRLGAGLFFDQTQLQRALLVAERIAAKAIVEMGASQTEMRTTPKLVLEAERHPRFPPPNRKSAQDQNVGAEGYVWKQDGIDVVQGLPNRNVETEKFGPVGGGALDSFVTRDGYYRFRIHATVDPRGGQVGSFLINYGGNTPVHVSSELAIDPSGVSEVTLFLRAGEPGMKRELRLLWTDTRQAIIAEPVRAKLESKRKNLQGEISRGVIAGQDVSARQKQLEEVKAQEAALTTPQRIWNPALDRTQLPVLHLDKIEVEGPIESEWPPRSHKSLFFAGNARSDESYVREIFTRFLPRAYRRPVSSVEVERVVRIVQEAMQSQKMTFTAAMRHGLARVLCSSSFWFLEREQPTVPQYALASRLSYFLWSSLPDDELFTLAAAGKLADKATLSAQVDRMLKDSRSEQFVRNFAGQWLGVREFGSVEPANEYKDYDSALKAAGIEEPCAFFAEVLQNDLPITNFLDSDFAVVNERLARHYGIGGVQGPEFRRVPLKPDDHRGGVLGMAGLMTYLADGTRTLPMRRGTWVLTNLFNDPPGNPPPNAGEIQPNTAGANLTLRERIEMHRSDATCASCHAKLDPYGLALENYDAVGAWRTRANGEGFRANKAPPIDPSGTFLNGPSFQTLEEYKACLLEQKDKFARCLTTKLLTYALGRPIGYADHEVVDAVVAELKAKDYRTQALVQAVVLSDAFQTK